MLQALVPELRIPLAMLLLLVRMVLVKPLNLGVVDRQAAGLLDAVLEVIVLPGHAIEIAKVHAADGLDCPLREKRGIPVELVGPKVHELAVVPHLLEERVPSELCPVRIPIEVGIHGQVAKECKPEEEGVVLIERQDRLLEVVGGVENLRMAEADDATAGEGRAQVYRERRRMIPVLEGALRPVRVPGLPDRMPGMVHLEMGQVDLAYEVFVGI